MKTSPLATVFVGLMGQAYAFPQLLHSQDEEAALIGPQHRGLSRVLQDDQTIQHIRDDVEAIIDADIDLAAKFVRLLFHSCVGGCNGCVDMADPENAGLDPPIDALTPVVTAFPQMSRADIWVLAGFHAAELASADLENNNNNFLFEFPYSFGGRTDCDANPSSMCTNINGVTAPCGAKNNNFFVFPSPDFSTQELLDYMSVTFNFDAQETVAILGAHTLGIASRENSGFPGENGWVNNRFTLNNDYYDDIVSGPANADLDDIGDAPGWSLSRSINSDLPGIPDRHLWFRTGREGGGGGGNRQLQNVIVNGNAPNRDFMLNVDIALVRDFSNDITADGNVDCNFDHDAQNACPYASTIRLAAGYEDSNNLWLNDFRDAFEKMSLTGYSTNPAPAPAPTPVTICFSGDNSVELVDGSSIAMKNLKIGDRVLVDDDGSFEKVYSFGHRDETTAAEYIQLSIKNSIVEISSTHLIYANNEFVPASNVQVGDVLSNEEAVSDIKSVTRKGMYAPFTASGTIVVSGIRSSCFVTLQDGAPKLMIGSYQTPLTWQWIAHSFASVHQTFASLGETYTEDGMSMWVAGPRRLGLWMLEQESVVVQAMLLIPAIGVLALLSLLSKPISGLALVAGAMLLTSRVVKKRIA